MPDVAATHPNGDDMFPSQEAPGPLFGVCELSPSVLKAYARLWQFETWLRRLVYVQLRALDGDADRKSVV